MAHEPLLDLNDMALSLPLLPLRRPPRSKSESLRRQLARESLSPTLALAARDTSTLSVTSTQHDLDDNAAWVRDGRVR